MLNILIMNLLYSKSVTQSLSKRTHLSNLRNFSVSKSDPVPQTEGSKYLTPKTRFNDSLRKEFASGSICLHAIFHASLIDSLAWVGFTFGFMLCRYRWVYWHLKLVGRWYRLSYRVGQCAHLRVRRCFFFFCFYLNCDAIVHQMLIN